MRILVVDDDPDIRHVAALGLSRVGGFAVVEAASGEEALALAALAPQPDAVLLDVMMPGLDGPDTLARLREDPRTAAIPVVFLTAKALKSETGRLRGLGACGVLTKPFDPMRLAADLRAILARSSS
jgi:two-component system OmpR family response regulator